MPPVVGSPFQSNEGAQKCTFFKSWHSLLQYHKKIYSGAYGLTTFFFGPFFKLGHNYHAQQQLLKKKCLNKSR